MSDLQLLDGRVFEAVNAGEWVLVGSVGFVLVLGLVLGFLSWLKGRKFVAFLVWLLLLGATLIITIPLETIQSLIETDSSSLHWALFGFAGASIGIGLITSIRLARPPSWWAQRRYDNDRYAEAIERHQWTRPQAR